MRFRSSFFLSPLKWSSNNGAGDGVTEAMGLRENIGMGQSGCAVRKFLCACMEN